MPQRVWEMRMATTSAVKKLKFLIRLIKTIMTALASGENVEINSFRKFVHVNVKTGETIEISARRSVILHKFTE